MSYGNLDNLDEKLIHSCLILSTIVNCFRDCLSKTVSSLYTCLLVSSYSVCQQLLELQSLLELFFFFSIHGYELILKLIFNSREEFHLEWINDMSI